jgi:hypothetical protein
VLYLPTTLLYPQPEPVAGPVYDIPPIVDSSTRWWRLRPGRPEERYRRFARDRADELSDSPPRLPPVIGPAHRSDERGGGARPKPDGIAVVLVGAGIAWDCFANGVFFFTALETLLRTRRRADASRS